MSGRPITLDCNGEIDLTKKTRGLALVVSPTEPPADPAATPPRPLGTAGLQLWSAVVTAYDLADVGGREILAQACSALDRAEELAAAISRDGAIVASRTGPKEHPGIKGELANRAFVVRSLQRLGLDVEPIRPTAGRPPGMI